VALELLRRYAPPRPVRLLGVRVAGFNGEGVPAARESSGIEAGGTATQLALPLAPQ
jgi:DNA polymerase-4